MSDRGARTFGEFIAMVREDAAKVHLITSPDKRPDNQRVGDRVFRDPVRNRDGNYQHCADREMIRTEFSRLWDMQKSLGGETSEHLTDLLRRDLDNPEQDSLWRHQGTLFGQRRQSWDLGTLGRCSLHPDERCVPHADRHASRYLVIEFVNNLRIKERGCPDRQLTFDERFKIVTYLSGPLGLEKTANRKGKSQGDATERPKASVTVTDLRKLMGWGIRSKASTIGFNIEVDSERKVNTDWFSREIIHGVYGVDAWQLLDEHTCEGINRLLLKLDPSEPDHEARLRVAAITWGQLDDDGANRLVLAWRRRPNPQARRLSMSRRATRNLLALMDCKSHEPVGERPDQPGWLDVVTARQIIAKDEDFIDVTTGQPLDQLTLKRYLTGAKGATARDRHYLKKHILFRDGEPIIDQFEKVLSEPPPAPLLSNPVARKAIHEVRRHLVEYLTRFGQRPDYVFIELSRQAKMGKKDADRILLRNRTRNRIRNEIIAEFGLDAYSATQQRAATDRVLLAVHQAGICPLCGNGGLTPRIAALTSESEIAHIIPRAAGGDNGFNNIVLAHKKCNRDMKQRTPRQFWNDQLEGGFNQGIGWVEKIYANIVRPKLSEIKSITGQPLWSCYFDWKDDQRKVDQFKKDVKDIQSMTARQDAATKYATRQIMSYLADALFDGKGLPERSDTDSSNTDRQRRIFATDGRWTARLRREWGLFFDPHGVRNKGLSTDQEHERKEKDRGDHRHHAIDAILIGLSDRRTQMLWEKRECEAEEAGLNTADDEAMSRYRRDHPLPVPLGYETIDEFRRSVRLNVYGTIDQQRPISHRATKRKLIGALHEETLLGPVLDEEKNLTEFFTAKKSVLDLSPNHLRMPVPESRQQSIARLANRMKRLFGTDVKQATSQAKAIVDGPGFHPKLIDPPPGKSGLVRDIALRKRLRTCLVDGGLNPDEFSKSAVKNFALKAGFRHASGVPIKTVILLRTMNDPIVVSRYQPDYSSNRLVIDPNPNARRAYLGGNNHHIEIRSKTDKKGKETISGVIVSAYEAAQRKLARLEMIRIKGVPQAGEYKRLRKQERLQYAPILRAAEVSCPIIDRRDNDELGGQFLMSLSEGETLWMRHKRTNHLGYFVVAKLDKPNGIVLVPDWDARKATGRKDSEDRPIKDSGRDQFTIVPSDLRHLAPPGLDFATKVNVSPLGKIKYMVRD
jgi:5-methylcytosine-specific restriction endonuclease McrA